MNTLILLAVLAIFVLYLGLFKAKKALLPVSVIGLLAAFALSVNEWNAGATPIYKGMMLFDNFAVAFSCLLIFSTLLIFLLSKDYFEKISDNVAEYYTILLFALAGIVVMVSYHNLSMLFIGIEIMSVSLYILAGIKRKDFASNEAALKYFLMGAFSTGFLLFGITLIYGISHSFDLEVIKQYVISNPNGISPMFYTGIALLMVGLCFKVGAAPFHFWTPDVYEGSPTLITAFMSTVVKTAGFAAFLRLFLTCFAPLSDFWVPILTAITILTLFIGNITALYQTSFKRMLAYSSISHAGYLLFAVLIAGSAGINSIFVYAIAYTLASLIAFGVLMVVSKELKSDSFDSFNGLAKQNPMIAFMLTVAMLSLAGIPLTAGFIGKFFMFSNILGQYKIALIIVAIVNAVISICYYFRVIVALYFKEGKLIKLETPLVFKFVFIFCALLIVIIGIYPAIISNFF